MQSLFVFQIFCPKSIFFGSFTWTIIHMDCVGFLFMISKFKNDINYIKYKFSHKVGRVCPSSNMNYSKIIIIIILKVTTMSIWIILNNLVWTYKECKFVDIEPLHHAFTLDICVQQKKKSSRPHLRLHWSHKTSWRGGFCCLDFQLRWTHQMQGHWIWCKDCSTTYRAWLV